MTCPCGAAIVPLPNPIKDGTHREHQCGACRADLQWDEPVTSTASGNIRTGPPRACSHDDLRRKGALVPNP